MREWMATPSVIVDETRLRRNIERMQQLADANHVQLRPHVKTHKTVEIAAMQLGAGACGITVAKPTEALKFLHSGLKALTSILVAYPVVQTAKVSKLLVAAQQFGIEVFRDACAKSACFTRSPSTRCSSSSCRCRQPTSLACVDWGSRLYKMAVCVV